VLPCGIAGVDEMIGGGLDRASVTLLGGNSGVGKSTLGMSFLIEAALRGERVVVYSFDETPAELVHRCEAIGMAIRPLMDAGTLHIEKVSPLGLYPDEFASWITDQVGRQQARVLMIDTLNGYRLCMDDADAFVGHLQQLVGYLKGEGVTTLLVEELAQLTGDLSISRSGMSYITDTILLLKSYEQRGRVLKAVGAIKKRLSAHHEAFREFSITARGIRVGDPLPQLRGILQGEAVTGGVPSEKADRNPGGSPDG
jgi:circadian clock protein KaiC